VTGLNRVRAVERLAAASDLFEHRGWREPGPELLFELAQASEDLLGADLIDEPERAAPERREAEPEDRADVAVTRAPEDEARSARRSLRS
jgi:hypothetical protein